jgi:hypothetical protein
MYHTHLTTLNLAALSLQSLAIPNLVMIDSFTLNAIGGPSFVIDPLQVWPLLAHVTTELTLNVINAYVVDSYGALVLPILLVCACVETYSTM